MTHYEQISLNKQRVANESRVAKGKKGAKTRVGWCFIKKYLSLFVFSAETIQGQKLIKGGNY